MKDRQKQWPTEKGQITDKQRSTDIIHKANERITRTPLNTGGELSIYL